MLKTAWLVLQPRARSAGHPSWVFSFLKISDYALRRLKYLGSNYMCMRFSVSYTFLLLILFCFENIEIG